MLQPTGQAALARLGLLGDVEALGARVDRLHGVTDGGATIFDLAYAELDHSYYAIGIHRAALHGALWRAFATCGASLETGRDDRRRRAGLRRQGRVARRQRTYRSGLRSRARRVRCAFAVARRRSPATGQSPSVYGAVWASVPDLGIASGRLAQRYVAARVMIGYLPIGRATAGGPDLAALFWSLKTADYDAWRKGFAQWRERIVELWPELAPNIDLLREPDDLTLASYLHFTARETVQRAGRVGRRFRARDLAAARPGREQRPARCSGPARRARVGNGRRRRPGALRQDRGAITCASTSSRAGS